MSSATSPTVGCWRTTASTRSSSPRTRFPGDPIVPYLAFPDEPSQYGPLWVLVGDALAQRGAGDLLADILLYKGVAALAHLVGACWC